MICKNCGEEVFTLYCEDVDNENPRMICGKCIGFREKPFSGFGHPTISFLNTRCDPEDTVMMETMGEFCCDDGPFVYDIDGFIVDTLIDN